MLVAILLASCMIYPSAAFHVRQSSHPFYDTAGFQRRHHRNRNLYPIGLSLTAESKNNENEDSEREVVKAIPILSSVTDPTATRLREDLLQLAQDTHRGFESSSSQRKRVRTLINDLARFNPTPEPAAPYYEYGNRHNDAAVTLAGTWTLVYTDAPDITSLDTRSNPLATATLGRIGQECTPPFIKNVIEWKAPEWLESLPLPRSLTGSPDTARILQKVCVRATASPSQPLTVRLKLVGLEVVAPPSKDDYGNAIESINIGLVAEWFRNNPLTLQGPLTAPFGQFEILYLDEELRIVRTGQNFVAVNQRTTPHDEWF